MKHAFSYPILIFASWLSFFTSCATQTTITYKPETKVEKPSGIYVGMMSFADDVQNITDGKTVFLNEEGGLFLVRALVNRYKASHAQSTAFPKAIEQAASAINDQYEYFPQNVQSVNIVVITDKKPSENPSSIKVIGKDVNIHYFTIGGDISKIASKLTEKSSIVYFVLDAAPSDEKNAAVIQYSAVSMLDVLYESIDPDVSTPMTKIFFKEKKSKSIDWSKTGDLWLFWGAVVFCVGLIAGLTILLVSSGYTPSDPEYN